MDYENGIIEKIQDGVARVKFEPKKGCGSCKLCQSTPEGGRYIEIPATPDMQVGQELRILINPKARVYGALLLFLIPIIIFIAGFGLFYLLMNIAPDDDGGVLLSLGVGLAVTVLYYIITGLALKKGKLMRNLQTFIVEK